MQHIPISAVGFRDFHRAVLPRTQPKIALKITAKGGKPLHAAFLHAGIGAVGKQNAPAVLRNDVEIIFGIMTDTRYRGKLGLCQVRHILAVLIFFHDNQRAVGTPD